MLKMPMMNVAEENELASRLAMLYLQSCPSDHQVTAAEFATRYFESLEEIKELIRTSNR